MNQPNPDGGERAGWHIILCAACLYWAGIVACLVGIAVWIGTAL